MLASLVLILIFLLETTQIEIKKKNYKYIYFQGLSDDENENDGNLTEEEAEIISMSQTINGEKVHQEETNHAIDKRFDQELFLYVTSIPRKSKTFEYSIVIIQLLKI